MLTLTRYNSQQIIVGEDILVTVTKSVSRGAIISIVKGNKKFILERYYEEEIKVSELFGIKICILDNNPKHPFQVRVGIEAPVGINILRSELYLMNIFYKMGEPNELLVGNTA